jgi:hypothetical protein
MPFHELYGFSTCYFTWSWLPNEILHDDPNMKFEEFGNVDVLAEYCNLCLGALRGAEQKYKVRVQLVQI